MELKLTPEQLLPLLEPFHQFYNNFEDITDYYLSKKLERLTTCNYPNIINNLYNDTTISPVDMSFEIVELGGGEFSNHTTQIASFPIESQIGRSMTLGLKETNTGKYIGFIRLASPVSSIKPRNDYFGKSLPLSIVNPHFVNGQTIVPVQPFGFNYLGGKLTALTCISNEVRTMWNNKYGTELLVFETTSLYGSTKTVSMYDGLEPYVKFRGLTESENYLFPTESVYYPIRDLCREHYPYDGDDFGMCVKRKGASPKMREFTKILSIIKEHLKSWDKDELERFNILLKTKCKSRQQKRFYMSNFGYTNVKEHLLNGTPLERKDSHKYDFNNIVEWWRKKATNRWTNLNNDNRLRTELEYFTPENIQQGLNFNLIR